MSSLIGYFGTLPLSVRIDASVPTCLLLQRFLLPTLSPGNSESTGEDSEAEIDMNDEEDAEPLAPNPIETPRNIRQSNVVDKLLSKPKRRRKIEIEELESENAAVR